MENVSPISKGALRIGEGLVRGAKVFRKGVVSSLNFGKETVNRTAQKINDSNKKITTQRKRQRDLDRREDEQQDKQDRETKVEATKIRAGGSQFIKRVVKKPIDALMKLIAGWAIANLPAIISEVMKFIKKVRIVAASVNSGVKKIGGVFQSLMKIAGAFVENLKEFDFNDKSGRIKEARKELDESMDEVELSFNEVVNVWGREEEELDKILESLESGEDLNKAIKELDRGMGVDGSSTATTESSVDTQPRNTVVGPQAQSSDPYAGILKFISSGEGGYNSMNQGTIGNDIVGSTSDAASKIGKNLTDMTIGEVMERQRWLMDRNNPQISDYGIFAAGAYQIIPDTMPDALRFSGLKKSDMFSPKNQDKLAIGLINSIPEARSYLEGESDDQRSAMIGLARMWASLPNPETGGSMYGSGNAAGHTVEEYKGALTAARGDISAPEEQPMPAMPDSNQLVAKVPMNDLSRTRSEGGRGAVGKTDVYDPRGTINSRARPHMGVDIGTSGQKGWYCALKLNGKVTYNGYAGNGGWAVFIKCGDKEFVFMHLARKSKLTVGARYSAGTPIGEIGNTGRSSSEHLHFEVRIDNKHIDPTPFLKYLDVGKLNVRAAASNTNMSGTSQERSSEVAQVASSRRTNTSGGSTTVIRQTEVVMVG